MKILGIPVPFTKNYQLVDIRTSWLQSILEPFTGAWQRNIKIDRMGVISYGAVFSCITLISADIAKLRPMLMALQNGVWIETMNPAYSPVLRKPNRYQTWQKFIEFWIMSLLLNGNTYVLKVRDGRGVVTSLHILDPKRVMPLITPQGDVYYQLDRDDLAQVLVDPQAGNLVVPASEIIHDRIHCLFHPLVGVSPIFACGMAATQGLKIQNNSALFFENMSRPSGMLTAPGEISDPTAERLKKYWEQNFTGNNIGRLAVLGDGLEYKAMTISAVDSQLIEQLKWTAVDVCSCFHVPPFKIGIGQPPTNPEHANLMYYSDCLQSLIESVEANLDEGLALGTSYRTELDLTDLIRMDQTTQITLLNDSVKGGWMSPDEARARQGMLPTPGGDTPYMQQQNYSLAALQKRDQKDDPFATGNSPAPALPAPPAEGDDPDEVEVELGLLEDFMTKAKNLLIEEIENAE